MENVLFVLFLLEKDMICTEIIIFATEIRHLRPFYPTRQPACCQQHQKTVLKISEDLNFPNPAFFCKYFKRLTAMTPLEYRWKE